jgi:hypothetical protein
MSSDPPIGLLRAGTVPANNGPSWWGAFAKNLFSWKNFTDEFKQGGCVNVAVNATASALNPFSPSLATAGEGTAGVLAARRVARVLADRNQVLGAPLLAFFARSGCQQRPIVRRWPRTCRVPAQDPDPVAGLQPEGGKEDRMLRRRKFHLLMLCALLTVVVYGQEPQGKANTLGSATDKAAVSAAIAAVKSGDFAPAHVETIAAAGAVEAIPILKEQFARSHDWLIKAKLASALVRLGGDQDDSYWDFLVKQATLAVESDAPDFMNFDPQAKDSTGPSHEFTAWANAHKLDAQEAGGNARNAMYRIMILSSTGDRRAIPLLRQGLLSPSHEIEYMAALGLAELQDKDSVPLILQACKIAPEAVAPAIAESLVYFDDPEAQKAVDTYVPKERARILREGKAAGKNSPF